jgi:hypothetical protein
VVNVSQGYRVVVGSIDINTCFPTDDKQESLSKLFETCESPKASSPKSKLETFFNGLHISLGLDFVRCPTTDTHNVRPGAGLVQTAVVPQNILPEAGLTRTGMDYMTNN